jgi:hypothetical protein
LGRPPDRSSPVAGRNSLAISLVFWRWSTGACAGVLVAFGRRFSGIFDWRLIGNFLAMSLHHDSA